MYLSKISLTNFRNYKDCSISFMRNGALFYGKNGSGKTNMLESIFFLCTARSQRLAYRPEMINFDSGNSFIEGVFSSDGNPDVTVSAGFSRDKKIIMKVDGSALSSPADWFGRAAIIPFGPDDINLVHGQPSIRRTFIDMLLCQIDTLYMRNLAAYKKNCAQRNSLLSACSDDIAIDIYEKNMAETGAEIVFKRQELVNFMSPFFSEFYAEISNNKEIASITYKPSIRCDLSSQTEWKNVFYSALKNTRKKDEKAGFTSTGPHRDDIALYIDGKPVKQFASQGQKTTLMLSMRMCSIICCEAHKKDTMLFLFDDALTYLDEGRTSKVFPLVMSKGQVFIATSSLHETSRTSLPVYDVDEGQVSQRQEFPSNMEAPL
jgi:DNA replication and repair protein RecF